MLGTEGDANELIEIKPNQPVESNQSDTVSSANKGTIDISSTNKGDHEQTVNKDERTANGDGEKTE